ncbi:amine dehydrogenase large subunit [Ideonella sp. A 288]|uniref:amine dehydrogenase large subunit n=1 Tax=Ideonella sp. A 288 TaxID=1962181 RepID=UPI000B4B08ED|nr:amine dehydrogenase large subunit [Ideonella sp. A 288]
MTQRICPGPARAAAHVLAVASLALLGGFSGAALAAKPAAKAAPKPVPAELQPETLTTSSIDAKYGARVYLADVAISHISDGRIRVYDAMGGKFLGMISTAYAGNFALSDKRDEVYVATTHLSRSTRGDRADVLEVYDTQSLAFKYEVLLPAKRAQALNYRGLVRATGNGKFVLVQNATPATSITVVDLANRKVASEIPTPGCWGVMPAATHGMRFSMLCGDGTVATVTLDDNGQPADRQSTAKLFDADKDAWFHHAEQVGDRYWFLSYQGTITEMNLGGAVGQVKGTVEMVGAADRKAGWRPGGYQNFAVDPQGRWLVAGMHPKGAEGSHKLPADKLWVIDLQAGKRRAVLPGVAAVVLNFSQNGQRLHAVDGMKMGLYSWAWNDGKLKKLAHVPAAGEASLHMESHD